MEEQFSSSGKGGEGQALRVAERAWQHPAASSFALRAMEDKRAGEPILVRLFAERASRMLRSDT